MKKEKKAVSPVIATVLLIMIVIILAIIILLWSRGFVSEVITKEINGESKNVEIRCQEISIKGIVHEDGGFGFENVGNVPISSFRVKTKDKATGDSTITRMDSKVNPGFSVIIEGMIYEEYEQVSIIPVLLGKKEAGQTEEYECPESDNYVI